MTAEPARPTPHTTRVVVATTALLSFLSLWRAVRRIGERLKGPAGPAEQDGEQAPPAQ